MTEDAPPPLAERIIAMFGERINEWLPEQGIVMLALASALAMFWIAYQKARDRVEVEFMLDLTLDTALAYTFSRFIRVFTNEIVDYAHESGGVASTYWGELAIMIMEALHYFPLLAIFAFQTLWLCKRLRQRWRDE